MKKKLIVFICLILIFSIFVNITISAYAEALTIAAVGAGLIAVAAASGVIYKLSNQSGSFKDWAQNRVQNWLDGRSLTEAFQGQVIKSIAGKMVIPSLIFNAINEMIEDDIEETGVTPGGEPVPVGFDTYGRTLNYVGQGNPFEGVSVSYEFEQQPEENGLSATLSGDTISWYLNGNLLQTHTSSVGTPERWFIYRRSTFTGSQFTGGIISKEKNWGGFSGFIPVESVSDVEISLDEQFTPQTIPRNYQWEGDFGAAPDTNLDQLMSGIYQYGEAGDIIVDGTTDVVQPWPIPDPTYPPVDDILPGINTGIAIGNDILIGQQTQTGEITQAIEGIQEGVADLTNTVEQALKAPEIDEKTFDLRELFPFCIPFDIYHLLQKFDGSPAAPHVQIPIVIPSIGFSYSLDLDFSPWDPVAATMRTIELIVYALGLAWATSKVIKW